MVFTTLTIVLGDAGHSHLCNVLGSRHRKRNALIQWNRNAKFMEPCSQFLRKYVIEDYIAKGAFATVFACRQPGKPKALAAKLISFHGDRKLQWEAENEVEILKDIHYHPHIVTLQAVFRTPASMTMILERMPNVPLFHGIAGWPHFSELDAKLVTRQILEALKYCHSKRIVHRDISSVNILWQQCPTIDNPSSQPWLRLIDFNLSRWIPAGEDKVLSDALGHTLYMAPEAVQETPVFGFGTDIWAVGVILFLMLVGYPPFWDDNYNFLLRNIEEGNFVMPQRYWKDISDDAKNLVRSMLELKLQDRISAQKALRHRWLQRHNNCDINNNAELAETRARLLVFVERTKEHSGSDKSPKQMKLKAGMQRVAYVPDKLLLERVDFLMEQNSRKSVAGH